MESACRIYRPRDPTRTPLWGLLDTLYERVMGAWEERYERRYGFWRGLADEAVARYLGGFSVHNRVYAHPGDGRDFEALVRYMMRSPVSLTRLHFTPGAKEVLYARKSGHDASEPGEDERVDAEVFVARVLVQIPDPRRHLVRYYGAYSNRARGQRRKAEAQLEASGSGELEEPVPPAPERADRRRRWANLIRRVYEVDPLVCSRCGAEMRVIGFITEPSVIKRILDHIRRRDRVSRPPPHPQTAVADIA